MTSANPIRNVSDTALWVAIYRAMESERPDAIFHDPYARRLGGERGQAIVDAMPRGRAMSWPMVVRTAVMDEIILRCVRQGAATVLNLAAGLDARPYRLALPASLRWLHVDLPDMVDYYRSHMDAETPRCELEFIAADLRDADARRAVFAKAAQNGPVLAITEGLLVYLEAGDVAALARDLHDVADAKWWLSDLASPMLLKYLERQWQPMLQQGNAPFRFGPAENTGFFAPFGWRELEFRPHWDESQRLKRTMPHAWLWNLLRLFQSKKQREAMKRFSGIMLLESTRST
ncbi:class I SAM-dependent methyltransferase [Lysobacter solisilvae (ex Woo and Kim 2020)]|uniref:S-adenosyl-L-methionine-dependent methyltransferase n=1 Tax=Agrilutibacter terrestris TaxID=2865112 RepID=A0A7H0FXT7_9GAMM|nr:class I SAM-dependent methyltransferase [Lysobacter terrestris]QNP40853.1 class I SAM-dependent methyltransferase [Lysobacter terrestris]